MKALINLFFLLSATLCGVPADAETTLTIYYTASLNGNLDGCTCEMNPVAGLVKRAAYLRNLDASSPTVILDAGDIFDEYPDLEPQDVEQSLRYAAWTVDDTIYVPTDYDFSKGERAKFYHPDAAFSFPVYLEPDVNDSLSRLAEQKQIDIQDLVNDLLRAGIKLIQSIE